MAQLLIRIVINAVALVVTAAVVPGIAISGNFVQLAVVAIVFGLVNAFIKPIISLISCPLMILTLGLFTLVINALMLMLTGYLAGESFVVNGFIPALIGGIVVGVVSFLLSMFLVEED